MAWKNTSTSRGVGAAPTLTAAISSRPSIARRPENISASAFATAAASSSGTGSPACSSSTFLIAARERRLGRLALLVGLRGEHRLEPGLELLPDPRHGEEPRRLDQRQVGDDLARVVAAGDRHRVDDRQVVVGGALGDVRRRQPRDDLRPVGELDHRLDRSRSRPSGCDARAGRPWADPWCPTCRSASAGPRARPRATRCRRRTRGWSPRRPPTRACPRRARPRARSRSRAPAARPGTPPRRSPPTSPRRRPRRRPARAPRSGRSSTAPRPGSSPRGRRGGTPGGWRASARRCRRASRRAWRARRPARRRGRAARPR